MANCQLLINNFPLVILHWQLYWPKATLRSAQQAHEVQASWSNHLRRALIAFWGGFVISSVSTGDIDCQSSNCWNFPGVNSASLRIFLKRPRPTMWLGTVMDFLPGHSSRIWLPRWRVWAYPIFRRAVMIARPLSICRRGISYNVMVCRLISRGRYECRISRLSFSSSISPITSRMFFNAWSIVLPCA